MPLDNGVVSVQTSRDGLMPPKSRCWRKLLDGSDTMDGVSLAGSSQMTATQPILRVAPTQTIQSGETANSSGSGEQAVLGANWSEVPAVDQTADKSKTQDAQTQAPDEKKVIAGIEQANKVLKSNDSYLKFSIHKQTKQIVVKIMNSETNEVIREVPSEKILDMIAKLCELAGIMVDERR